MGGEKQLVLTVGKSGDLQAQQRAVRQVEGRASLVFLHLRPVHVAGIAGQA